jgi:multidrug efflux pump
MRNAVVNVSTTYFGADADLIQGFITTPLEREIASAEGIDYLTSTSAAGISSIQAYIQLDKDPNEALSPRSRQGQQRAASCRPTKHR